MTIVLMLLELYAEKLSTIPSNGHMQKKNEGQNRIEPFTGLGIMLDRNCELGF